MSLNLPFIWAGLVAFAVLAYVILDGFDLGVGILFPLARDKHERDIMMNSVAPIWDGNETWLVLGGGSLMAAFPLAYATVLSALYAPIIAMLLGLILRGVAFEFRWHAERSQFLWDWAFSAGSTIAALAQGIALGALVQGIPVTNRVYSGGWWDWLTPFTLLTGVAVVSGYALLGSTWLFMKTVGEIQNSSRRHAWNLAICTFLLMAVVSIWTPLLNPVYFNRWLAWPAILYSGAVPVLVTAAAALLFAGLHGYRDRQPFFAALVVFVLNFAGLGISFYPFIVPPSLTIWETAAPDKSLLFLLVGAAILIPVILAYTSYSYWVFRGKLDPEEGYH